MLLFHSPLFLKSVQIETPPGKLVPFTLELILPELEIIESVCKLRVCELFYFNSLRTTGKFMTYVSFEFGAPSTWDITMENHSDEVIVAD